jgi:hypothetical protein
MTEQPTVQAPAPEGRLYSVRQIILATFVGAPLAGCVLLAQNYRVLGQSTAVLPTLLAGGASTALLLALAFILPDNFPNLILPVASCFALRQMAIYLQGERISTHMTLGGKKRSWWIVVAIGAISLVLIFGVIFVVVLIGTSILPAA